MKKRNMVKALGVAATLAVMSLSAVAQTPSKPVRIIVAFAAGNRFGGSSGQRRAIIDDPNRQCRH